MSAGGAAIRKDIKTWGERMNTVEPIRDIGIVEAVAHNLQQKSQRNYIMFCIGIYSGLRVSDILMLKVRDVKNKDVIRLIEQKTGNHRVYPIPSPLKRALRQYCEGMGAEEYLIANGRTGKPIGRIQAWRILRKACEPFGLRYIGTHTMRKTFGYHFYQQYGDVVMLMTIFGHTSESYTLRYIGINRKMIDEAILKFKPFKI